MAVRAQGSDQRQMTPAKLHAHGAPRRQGGSRLSESEARGLLADAIRGSLRTPGSVRELALRLGVNRETMRRILLGRSSPQLTFLLRFRAEFGVDLLGEIFRSTDDASFEVGRDAHRIEIKRV